VNLTEHLAAAQVATRASVYFDGKCISHAVTLADGSKKSVGVILPATLTFNTGAPEVMETTGGSCEVLLPGQTAWQRVGPGESFKVPGQASFQIKVVGEPYHYICHFG
jgi:purine/pyrimidine-nucleoside phosphorylase